MRSRKGGGPQPKCGKREKGEGGRGEGYKKTLPEARLLSALFPLLLFLQATVASCAYREEASQAIRELWRWSIGVIHPGRNDGVSADRFLFFLPPIHAPLHISQALSYTDSDTATALSLLKKAPCFR